MHSAAAGMPEGGGGVGGVSALVGGKERVWETRPWDFSFLERTDTRGTVINDRWVIIPQLHQLHKLVEHLLRSSLKKMEWSQLEV